MSVAVTQFPKYVHVDCVTDRKRKSKHVQVDGRERKPSRINTRYDECRLFDSYLVINSCFVQHCSGTDSSIVTADHLATRSVCK